MSTFNRREYREEIQRITAAWSDDFKRWADPVIQEIEFLIGAGYDVETVVGQVFAGRNLPAAIKQATTDAAFQAAAAGFGLRPAEIETAQKAIIVQKLNTTPWAPDGMNLSTRLHGLDPIVRQTITQTIQAQLARGTNWTELSRALYEGYGYGGKIRPADLPGYLDKLQRMSRQNITDPKLAAEYRRLLDNARSQAAKLGANDAPNKALKSAYQALIEATQKGNDLALQKAIETAIHERTRYYAERIARTEIARAWADGFFAEYGDDPDVYAYGWRLSTRHPAPDICDIHAKANLFGLGPGVYPKDAVPPQPAHPHCTCHLEPIFVGELPGLYADYNTAKINQRGRDFLNGLPRRDLVKILGVGGTERFLAGGDWQKIVPGWRGHENPTARLARTDFKAQPPPIAGNLALKPATKPGIAGLDQVPDQYRPWLHDDLEKAPEIYQKAVLNQYKDMQYKALPRGEGAYCSGYSVCMPDYKEPRYRNVFWHEFGHFYDKRARGVLEGRHSAYSYASEMARFRDAMEADYKTFQRRGAANTARREELDRLLRDPNLPYNDNSGVSDIFCSISGGAIRGRWGHSASYYKEASHRRGAEIFANLFELFLHRDTVGIEFVRRFMPKTVAEFEAIINETGGIQ